MKKTSRKGTTRAAHGAPIDPERLAVREVMQPDVLTVRSDDTVEAAVGLLEEYHVGAAPVLDGAGRFVGVFSRSDVTRRDRVGDDGIVSDLARTGLLDEEDDGQGLGRDLLDRDGYSDALTGRARVQDWMTPGLVSVGPDETLADACRTMLAESIHRVFVVEGGKLCGVVSTFDLVRLLAGEE